jgi:hypothetical protein
MQIAAMRTSDVVRSALITPLYLIGSFFIGALLGSLTFSGLPGHIEDATKIAMAAVPALACVVVGGALWGRAIARLTHAANVSRLTWAGALGYGPTLIGVVLLLTVLENLIVEQRRGPELPIHVVFTLLFVPAVFIVALVGALALGLALKHTSLLPALALGSGLAAGITFLIVDLVMDGIGYRVGAPGAAERATMITVLLTGSIAASLAAGALIGFLLSRGHRET